MRTPYPLRSTAKPGPFKAAAAPAKRGQPPTGMGGPAGRPNPVPRPDRRYPVFPAVVATPAWLRNNGPPDGGSELAWSDPRSLAVPLGALGPGLFVIERLSGRQWSPIFVGMSATGVGQALRWIIQAPAIVGLAANWDAFRVRVAEAGFDTTEPAGRATLRRIRDELARSIGQAEGRDVLRGPELGAA